MMNVYVAKSYGHTGAVRIEVDGTHDNMGTYLEHIQCVKDMNTYMMRITNDVTETCWPGTPSRMIVGKKWKDG